MYYNFIHDKQGTNQVPRRTTLYVPADMTITRMMKMDNADLPKPYDAYRLDFKICKDVAGYFILIQELNSQLAAAMQPPYDETQESDTGSGKKAYNYFKDVNIKLKTGEILGYAGGEAGFPDGLDLAITDSRTPEPKLANPKRWQASEKHFVCSLDYYDSALSKQLYDKIGDFSYKPLQPGEPTCGSVYQDELGTAQGAWATADTPADSQWQVHNLLFMGHSNFDHSMRAFSMGSKASQVGIMVNRPLLFKPVSEGTVNLDFNLVKPGPTVYCYNADDGLHSMGSSVTLLVQLVNETTVRLGRKNGSCNSGPSVLDKYVEYIR
jgi:hypothetical protein